MKTDVDPPSSRESAHDRLGSTLFLAALIHGVVILGVTFTVATYDDDTPDAVAAGHVC